MLGVDEYRARERLKQMILQDVVLVVEMAWEEGGAGAEERGHRILGTAQNRNPVT